MVRPRSVLYVPASRLSMLVRARERAADALIVDLEDAVAPAEKETARENLRLAAADGALDPGLLWMLRVNPAGSPWHEDDLSLAEALRPWAVVVPKAEDPAEVHDLADWFAGHGSRTALMIESASAIASIHDLAGAHPKIAALILGSADLRLSLGARPDPARAWEFLALQSLLVAARAHDLLAIDGVWFRYEDLAGLERHARIARDLGYDGKSCIHPAQVAVVNEIFRSGPQEIAWAERILDAWSAQDGDRRGIVVADGEMIEALHVTIARRLLERR